MYSSLYQVIRGIVQYSLPSLGVVYVRPILGAPFDQTLVCYMLSAGGYYGATIYNTPQSGLQVLVYKYSLNGRCVIVASSNSGEGRRNRQFNQANSVFNYPWSIALDTSLLTKNCLNKVSNPRFGRLLSDANGIPCDLVAGDLYLGDKAGGGLFIGKGIQLLKAGLMCSILLDAIHKKFVLTYLLKLLISLHSYEKDTPNATIKLRAASIDLQLGRKSSTNTPIYSISLLNDGSIKLKKETDTASLFRQQFVCGSAYDGSILVMVLPDNKQLIYTSSTVYPCVYLLTKSFTGHYSLRAQSVCSVKSASIKAPQYTLNKLLLIELKDWKQPDVDPLEILRASVDAPLLLEDYLLEPQVVFSELQARYMLLDGFYVFPTTLLDILKWLKGVLLTQQYLALPYHSEMYDSSTGRTHTLYKNTSFIQQAPDGSIFIKDGWGSLIRMSRGNIIISSALDTFIRPGRDCILLVPRLKLITANGPAVIAAKGSIKLGSLKDVKIASALAGGLGSTVLLNRTTDINSLNSGVVIRSNADMSITASKDMYIGLNDKTSKNAGDLVTPSNGTLMIDGGNVLTINCTQAVKFTAGLVQMFGHDGDRGSGITVLPSRIAMISPSLDIDSILRVGLHSKNSLIDYLGGTFSLAGASVYGIQLTGFIDCKQLVARQWITTLGNVIGGVYMTVLGQPQEQIYKLRPLSVRALKKSYGKLLSLLMLDINNILFVTVSCYADSFICDRLLHFLNSDQLGFSAYTMPGMCWQNDAQGTIKLTPVTLTKTGEDTKTASYPGMQLWDKAAITTVVDGKLNNDTLMAGNYFTNVKSLIKED